MPSHFKFGENRLLSGNPLCKMLPDNGFKQAQINQCDRMAKYVFSIIGHLHQGKFSQIRLVLTTGWQTQPISFISWDQ